MHTGSNKFVEFIMTVLIVLVVLIVLAIVLIVLIAFVVTILLTELKLLIFIGIDVIASKLRRCVPLCSLFSVVSMMPIVA